MCSLKINALCLIGVTGIYAVGATQDKMKTREIQGEVRELIGPTSYKKLANQMGVYIVETARECEDWKRALDSIEHAGIAKRAYVVGLQAAHDSTKVIR